MSLSKEENKEIIKKFGRNENDTGSSSVQVALLTHRIKTLSKHFSQHQHDHHSRLGLLKMVSARRKFLAYMKKRDLQQYRKLISDLGLRS